MHTLVRASFADGIRLAALSALPLLGVLVLAGTASAQQPNPFGPPQPLPPGAQPPPGAQQPPPGAQPNPFGGPPPAAPGGFGPAPGAPPPGAFGGPPPGPAPAPANPGDQGGQFGNGPGTASDQPAPPAADQIQTPAQEEQERWLSLMEGTNLFGSTGLLHSSYAGSGAPGTFRVSFLTDYFSASNFLCRPGDIAQPNISKACTVGGGSDQASRVGGTFAINVTPFSFLEAFGMLRTYATYDSLGTPTLLQVLGDTTLGVKAFLPPKLGRIFTFGGEAQLLILNGTGGVGVAGNGTSALFRALGSADFRKPDDGGFPLRLNLNVGYKLDNSGNLVEAVEEQRAAAMGQMNTPGTDPGPVRQPITRIERFGLGINEVDTVQVVIGAELPFSRVQPYVEWSVDIPSNRQGYYCHTGRVTNGDYCLGLENFSAADPTTAGGPGFKAFPSRFSLGVKTNPLGGPGPSALHGLSAHAALDIGTSGVTNWISELAPQAPWTFYIGLTYAFDTKEKEAPPAPPPLPAPPPQLIPAPQVLVRGLVHEQGRNDVLVADAIVSFEGGVQGPVATSADGHFVTRHLEPGTYKLDIKAPGFKPGSCQAVVVAAPAPALGAAPGAPPGGMPPGAPPSPFGAPPPAGPPGSPFGAPPAGPPGSPGAPTPPPGNVYPPPAAPGVPAGPTYVDIDCPVESLPKTGNLLGLARDAESNAPIGGAVIHLTDANNKEITVTADGNGNFVFKELPPGAVTLKGEAPGYLSHHVPAEVRASEDGRPTVQLTKRPKVASVKVEGKEIKISKQIHFETDSAKILGDSNSLLEEIVDVLQHNPNIKRIEIQGHTDNTGTRDHNLQLSDARANSVKVWLVGAGVDAGRLFPKGYGQDRPIAPNVTPANRTRNRRVQFIILDK